jgi:hypothetical protein
MNESGMAVIWYLNTTEQDFLNAVSESRMGLESLLFSKNPLSLASLSIKMAQLITCKEKRRTSHSSFSPLVRDNNRSHSCFSSKPIRN